MSFLIHRYFRWSCVLLLAITAISKLAIVQGGRAANYLSAPAPIFPELQWSHLLFSAALLEILVAGLLVLLPNKNIGLIALLWITALFGLFRLSLWFIGYSRPCNCLGSLADMLGMDQTLLTWIPVGILFYFLIGSVFCWLFRPVHIHRIGVAGILGAIVLVQECNAETAGIKVQGYQTISLLDSNQSSTISSCKFSLTRVGTNWSMVHTYENTGAKQYLAYVNGNAYTVSSDIQDLSVGGGVLNSPIELLDAAPEYARLLYFAFILSGEDQKGRAPAPFLHPRHPALHAYSYAVTWSTSSITLPESALLSLSDSAMNQITDEAMRYYYRDGGSGRKDLKQFARTQKEGAHYEVVAWTNFLGIPLPIHAKLGHTFYEEGRAGKRSQEIWVTNCTTPIESDLLISLPTNAVVQHVVDRTTYMYTASDGKWLSAQEAVRLGQIKRSSGRAPVGSKWIQSASRVIIVAMALAPLIFYLLHLLKKTNKERKTNEKSTNV